MTPWVVVGILVALALLGSMARGWQDLNDQWSRVSWTGVGCGLLIAVGAPHPWAAGVITVGSLGLIYCHPMQPRYKEIVAPSLMLAGAYVVTAPRMESWMVGPLLGAVAVVAALTGLWTMYSCLYPKATSYQHLLFGWLYLYDRDGGAPLAGQGNYNHSQSIGSLGTAAVLGLLWTGHVWPGMLLPLTLAPVIWSSEWRMTGRWFSQGILHVGVALLSILILVDPWIGTVGLLSASVGLLWFGKPWAPRLGWLDSNRFWTWKLALTELWWTALQPRNLDQALTDVDEELQWLGREYVAAQTRHDQHAIEFLHSQIVFAQLRREEVSVLVKRAHGQPMTIQEEGRCRHLWWQKWRIRLIGFGTGTWFPLTKWPVLKRTGERKADGRFEGIVYTSAHGEFVQMLFEHGVIGLLVLLGFCAHALWFTWTGGVAGHALWPVVWTMLSIAAINFPWSLFMEIPKSRPDGPEQFTGSPALIVLSFVVVVMVEAVTP